MKLGISPLAEQDLEAIGDYIAQDNPVRAVSFTEELYQQCLLIAESPVLYRERLLHGLRDVLSLFTEPGAGVSADVP